MMCLSVQSSTRTAHLKKLQERLCSEIASIENEEKCLQEYKTEMELLQQERMAHVEELRLIHADINLVFCDIMQIILFLNRNVIKSIGCLC